MRKLSHRRVFSWRTPGSKRYVGDKYDVEEVVKELAGKAAAAEAAKEKKAAEAEAAKEQKTVQGRRRDRRSQRRK